MSQTPPAGLSSLDILTFTVDHFEVRNPGPARDMLVEIADIAAIEWLDGKAGPLTGVQITPHVLELVVDLRGPDAAHCWEVWLDECDNAALKPQIIWRADDKGNRGEVHAAISKQVGNTRRRVLAVDHHSLGVIRIRADLTGLGAHRRLELDLRRQKFLTRVNNSDRFGFQTGRSVPI